MPALQSPRVPVDRPTSQVRFIVLGSASPQIVKRVSETLAGRVEFVELSGFDLQETGILSLEELWLRGGPPRAFLAASDDDSMAWREGFVRTFLERDLPQLGISIPAAAMRRFWTMLAHFHGQTWNASGLARSMGLTDKTVRSYLDILTGTFMVRQLQPWHETQQTPGQSPQGLPAGLRTAARAPEPSCSSQPPGASSSWRFLGGFCPGANPARPKPAEIISATHSVA